MTERWTQDAEELMMVRRREPMLLILGLLSLLAGCAVSQGQPAPGNVSATSGEIYFDQGMEEYRQSRWPQAARNFQEAVSRNPNHVEAWYHLALALEQQDMGVEAEDAAKQAVAVNPGYLPAREFMGLLFYSRNDSEGARLELEAARSLDSGNPEVYVALGEIYLADRLCKEAMEAFQLSIELHSADSRAREGLKKAEAACGGASGAKKENQGAVPQSTNPVMKSGAMSIDPSDF